DKYVRYLMIAVTFREAAPPEHQKLLECALRRDAKAAQAILATHVMDCVAYTLTNTPANLLGLHRPSGKRQSAELAAPPALRQETFRVAAQMSAHGPKQTWR